MSVSAVIQLLALALEEKIDAGTLSPTVIEQLIQRLSVEAFERRAERLRRYLGKPIAPPACSACGR
jgi:hypothetical protein